MGTSVRPNKKADPFVSIGEGRLEPIKAAAAACQDLALPTLINEVGKGVVTLLTLVAAATRPPGPMLALVILHQVGHLPVYHVLPQNLGHLSRPGIPVYNNVGAVE